METYISILRGINVSGKNIIKMEQLRELFITLKFQHVRTYIQSGNVIFQTKETAQSLLSKKIAEVIEKQFGFKIPVLTLTIDELKSAITDNPFLKKEKKDNEFLHVTFLSELPEKALFSAIEKEKYLPDEIQILSKCVYLYCPNGYGKTKLHNTFIENKLKVRATTRNWKTCHELIKIAETPHA